MPVSFLHPSSSAFGIAIAILHLVLAVIVTIDVLLKKSDVRGALGWIAAAWLSPIFGSLLYYLFGVNRVTRRAARLIRRGGQGAPREFAAEPDVSPHIAMLSDVAERITGEPLLGGNRLAILQGGDQAYPAMLAAIKAARKSIALESYVFRNDAVGQSFADALIEAHQRGVAVRVLLDSVGIGYFAPLILYRLQAGGVTAERFLHTWLPWRMPFLNMRNHRKLLVVDGAVAFTGGMNIGAENSQALTAPANIDDIHFKVEGPVVSRLMDTFARDWLFAAGEALDDGSWWPGLQPAGSTLARGLQSGPDSDIYKLEMVLGSALSLAARHVRIVTPYFLPDQRLQFAIAQACLRGVKVDIVIPDHCNFRFIDWAMRGHLRFFNHIAAVFHVTPLPFDHSKLVTVDGEWCLLGSSNWDARSLRLNFEFNLECYDAGLVSRLDEIIDAKIAGGRVLTSQELLARPAPVRIRDAAARLLMPYL